MKKLTYLLIFLLLITGCINNKKEVKEKEEPVEEIEEIIEEEQEPIEEYIDNNNTPIGLYLNKKKVTEYQTNIKIGKDIAKFQVFPSNDEYLSYTGAFGQAFHDKFSEYNKDNNLKIGFNMSYDVSDGRHFSQNILKVVNAYDYEGYILLFLYDDYDLYINNKIYSHTEKNQEKENTLFSSIKLYGEKASPTITSKIKLTVFTYDGEDDFDESGEYRGNSKYTITICEIGKTC